MRITYQHSVFPAACRSEYSFPADILEAGIPLAVGTVLAVGMADSVGGRVLVDTQDVEAGEDTVLAAVGTFVGVQPSMGVAQMP